MPKWRTAADESKTAGLNALEKVTDCTLAAGKDPVSVIPTWDTLANILAIMFCNALQTEAYIALATYKGPLTCPSMIVIVKALRHVTKKSLASSKDPVTGYWFRFDQSRMLSPIVLDILQRAILISLAANKDLLKGHSFQFGYCFRTAPCLSF